MNPDRIIAVRNDKTVYRDGNLCIKVFGKTYSKADVLCEALNHARAEETALHIPEIKEVCVVDGKWAIVSDYIKGKTLERLMTECPDKKDEYLDLFTDLQLEVHRQSCPLLTKLSDKMNSRILQTDFDATTRYELHTRLDAMPKQMNLCHGDFNPSNIIIAEDGTPYIIDWAHAAQGNAEADVARTYLLFWLAGDISGAEKYLGLFSQKSGKDKKDIQKWMPLVAAAQTAKGNEKEREFLNSWVNVVDYE